MAKKLASQKQENLVKLEKDFTDNIHCHMLSVISTCQKINFYSNQVNKPEVLFQVSIIFNEFYLEIRYQDWLKIINNLTKWDEFLNITALLKHILETVKNEFEQSSRSKNQKQSELNLLYTK